MLQYQGQPLDLAFQALSDPGRRAMVERLSRGPATVSELAGIVTGLVSQVADLATAVAGLVPGDHAPKRKPWTHMGSGS